MKYFNKRHNVQQKITDRVVLKQINLQLDILNKIFKQL